MYLTKLFSGALMTPEEMKITRAGTLWFPLAMVISIVAFAIVSAWVASGEKTRIDNKFEALTDNVKNLTVSVDKIIMKIGIPDTESITKQQWLIECLQLQAVNPGWHCPYAAQRMSWDAPIVSWGIVVAKW